MMKTPILFKLQPVAAGFDSILHLAGHGDEVARGALDRMAHCLVAGIAILAVGKSADVIVLVGEVINAWAPIGPVINDAVKRRSPLGSCTQIVTSAPQTQPRLRGAAVLVLKKTFIHS